MKILRIAQEIYPDVIGGGAYHAHALSRDQASEGHDVTVLTVGSELDWKEEITRSGYRIIRFPSTLQMLGNDLSVDVLRYLREHLDEFDIVHSHAHFYFASNIASFLTQFSDVPLAVTNHSLISQSVPKWIAKAHLKTLGKYTFEQAEVVFCYTEEERSRFERYGIDADVRVVSNGIDRKRFKPGDSVSSHIDAGGGPVVLFVGRFVEGKRPQDVIDAFARVVETHPDAELYLCGDGPLKAEMTQRVTEYGIDDAVTFLGLLDYDEMPDVYRTGDVLVLPSLSEGFPRTLMEAMSTETPVITTELEQTAEIARQGGYVVPTTDVDAITDRLRRLLDDPTQRRELGQRGREVIGEEGLTWASTVSETTDLLEATIASEKQAVTL